MKLAFTAFVLDPTGFGEAARRLLAALESAGLEVAPGLVLTDGNGQCRPEGPVKAFVERAPIALPDVHLIHATAMDFPRLSVATKRQIGATCWETDTLHPRSVEGCAGLDEVWIPSAHNLGVFTDAGLKARIIPYPVLEPPSGTGDLGLGIRDSTFVFYSVLTWQERKNPLGLLTSYLTGFTADDDVELILKISGPQNWIRERAERDLANLLEALSLPSPPRVRILTGPWAEDRLWRLHARGDCFVLLTRGEAYGLPILDALGSGSQIITTAYGGALDFLCSGGNPRPGVHLVRIRMTPVVQRYPHFNGTQCWADPDLLHARRLMRVVFQSRDGRAPKVRPDLSPLSTESVGKLVREALDHGH